MKLTPDKLQPHLQRQLAPVYLLHGDEPLQLMEAADQLREHARTQGYTERNVIYAAEDADWSAFRASADSLSLFSDKKIIDLRLPTAKPGRVGGEALRDFCARPPADVLLLVNTGRLDRQATNSAWFKAIDKAGVVLGASAVPPERLSAWLRQRLAAQGLNAEQDALTVIAERVEGNLLAAKQEIERLALLYPQGSLSHSDVVDAVADSARYSIGDLVTAVLEGRAGRAVRILRGLHDEAVADVLILWALSNEVRAGARVAESCAAGVMLDAALKTAGVWYSRSGPMKAAVARHDASSWLRMLALCSRLDRQIKGQLADQGMVQDNLEALVVQLAGQGLPLHSSNPAIPV